MDDMTKKCDKGYEVDAQLLQTYHDGLTKNQSLWIAQLISMMEAANKFRSAFSKTGIVSQVIESPSLFDTNMLNQNNKLNQEKILNQNKNVKKTDKTDKSPNLLSAIDIDLHTDDHETDDTLQPFPLFADETDKSQMEIDEGGYLIKKPSAKSSQTTKIIPTSDDSSKDIPSELMTPQITKKKKN